MYVSTIRWTETPGPPVSFQCARCKQAVTGTSRQRYEKVYALGLIPTFGKTNTFVTCDTCKAKFLSKLTIAQLQDHLNDDITQHLSLTNSFVITFLVVVAVLLFWTPFLGLILSAIATALTWKNAGGWIKMASRIALGLSILIHIGLAILMMTQK
jgi:hypothetical protein